MRRGEGEEPPPAPLCPALPLPQVLRTEVTNVCPGRVYLPQLLEEEEGVEVEGKVEVEEGPPGGSGGGRGGGGGAPPTAAICSGLRRNWSARILEASCSTVPRLPTWARASEDPLTSSSPSSPSPPPIFFLLTTHPLTHLPTSPHQPHLLIGEVAHGGELEGHEGQVGGGLVERRVDGLEEEQVVVMEEEQVVEVEEEQVVEVAQWHHLIGDAGASIPVFEPEGAPTSPSMATSLGVGGQSTTFSLWEGRSTKLEKGRLASTSRSSLPPPSNCTRAEEERRRRLGRR